MINISKILVCYFTLFKILQANELMECITQRQSGFHFLGKDYYEIIKYLGLDRFTISISRNRNDIIDNQNQANLSTSNKNLANIKNVHFLELIVTNSKNHPNVFHCSWRHKTNIDKISDNNYECIEQKDKKDLFSLDFFGNFSLSSRFDALNMKEKYKKNSTLHSIFGKCEIKKEE